MLIDTHAHLYMHNFEEDFDDVLERMQQAGVGKVLLPNVDVSTIEDNIVLMESFPGIFHSMLGLHPCSVKQDWHDQLNTIKEALKLYSGAICAIGEIGLDAYWDNTYEVEQEEAFRLQLDWALELGLPVVIHCRETIDKSIAIVEEKKYKEVSGVFHCFTGNMDQAKRICEAGFRLGIGGVSTFKNGGIEPVIREIELENMLLETDAPYLAPVPYRGKRNESSYVSLVARRMAEIRGIDVEEVAQVTTNNALALFSLV